MAATVRLVGESCDALLRQSEDLDMAPDEYVSLALNVAAQLPQSLLFAIAAGVPVRFMAAAYVGDGFEGVCDG